MSPLKAIHGYSTIWEINASTNTVVKATRRPVHRRVTVQSPDKGLISECELMTFEATVLLAKQLEQITSNLDAIIPEYSGGRVYILEQTTTVRKHISTQKATENHTGKTAMHSKYMRTTLVNRKCSLRTD